MRLFNTLMPKHKKEVTGNYLLFMTLCQLLEVVQSASFYINIFSNEKPHHYKFATSNDILIDNIQGTSISCASSGNVVVSLASNLTFQLPLWTLGDANNPFASLAAAINDTRNLDFERCMFDEAHYAYNNYLSQQQSTITMLSIMGAVVLFASGMVCAVQMCERKARKEERLRLLPVSKRDDSKIKEQREDIPLGRIPQP